MLDALAEIDALQARVVRGGGSGDAGEGRRRGRPAALRAASSCRASASRCCSTAARPSSSSRRSPAGAPTTRSAAAWSPASAGSAASSASSSANDPTVKGGAQGPTSVAKGLRAMEVARVNRLPLVSLTESAGADLPKQAEIFVPGGASFKNLTRLLRGGHPDDHPGVRLVDRRRRLRARHERLRRAAEGRGAGLPRRAAAGEDGDRRGRRRGVARRRRDARAGQRPGRLPRGGRAATRCASVARSSGTSTGASRARPVAPGRAAGVRRRRAARHRERRRQGAVRGARGDRPHRRRQRARGVQAALRHARS